MNVKNIIFFLIYLAAWLVLYRTFEPKTWLEYSAIFVAMLLILFRALLTDPDSRICMKRW